MPLELNENKRKLALVLFAKGNDAVKSNKLDYAIDCYVKCVKFVPNNLPYRQHLRAVERKYYKDNGSGASGAGLRTQPTRMSLRLAKGRKKWQDVIELAEDILRINPWDVDAQLEICNACKEIGSELDEVGHWVAGTAAGGKDRADALVMLADFCERRLMYGHAINALEVARKLAPDDNEIPSRIRRLGAQDTIQAGGYTETSTGLNTGEDENAGEEGAAASKPPKPSPRVIANAPPPETPEQKALREIKELEAQLAGQPASESLHTQIGDGYRRLGDYEASAKAYDAGFKACGTTCRSWPRSTRRWAKSTR
jgi:tetratricopeptide (TPR) repeat protein